jgi:tetratricopeptide (TPR) repeat protein
VAPPELLVQLIQRAVAAVQRRAWGEAAELANTVLQRFGPEPNALMLLASVRAETGDLPGAIEFYERACGHANAYSRAGESRFGISRATRRLQEARRSRGAALQVGPRYAIAHNNLGNVLVDLGERREGLRAYERAVALDPRYSDPVASLAKSAEEEHRLDDARRLAERALQLAPQNVLAALTLARVKLRQDDAAGATTILEALLRGGALSATNLIVAQGYLGEAYEMLARYDDAFAAFTQANAFQHAQYAATVARDQGPLAPASIARLTAFVAGVDPSAWRPAPPSAATPVFLIGFPRSGTTLLDQILASHPGVTTLEERDTLFDAANELMNTEEAFERWADLTPSELERLRELYWRRVRAGLSSAPEARVFVDKQPLNAALLPLIYRLFPAAKIILACATRATSCSAATSGASG